MTSASASLLDLTEKLRIAPPDSRLALLFPGQGSQQVGAGRDLFESSTAARHVFQRADAALGFSLTELCFHGPEHDLRRTDNAQPALLAVSLACLVAALESGALEARPAFLAGHSLGEYTALVAAGALDLDDALSLVRRRGQLTHQAGLRRPGAMAALLGLNEGQAEEICRLSSTEICNYNSPSQTVIGGPPPAVRQAILLASDRGGRGLSINVAGAFHTSFMASAARRFAAFVRSCPLRDPAIPVIANVSARPLTSADAVRAELEQQLIRPVLWRQSIDYMTGDGVSVFLEVGPGHVLASLLRRSHPTLTAITINDLASLAGLRRV